MPWKLIGFAILFGIFVAFITFNLHNTCDISYGPFESTKITEVPVFLTVFISFFAGLFTAIPFIVNAGKKRRRAGGLEGEEKSKKRWGKKKDNNDEPPLPSDAPPANVDYL